MNTLRQRIVAIAADFVPDSDKDAALALCEMRQALLDAVVECPSPAPVSHSVGTPVAWVIPGNDQARADGSIDAMAWEQGEFTRPLYDRAEASLMRWDRSAVVAALQEWSEQKYGQAFSISACHDLLNVLKDVTPSPQTNLRELALELLHALCGELRLNRGSHQDLINRARAVLNTPSPQSNVEGKAEAFDRIVAARKKHVDAVAAYNARREYVKSLPFEARFNLDAEHRAFSDAQSEFIKVAQEVADAALAAEGLGR